MGKFVLVQDRDVMFLMAKEDVLLTRPVVYDGQLMGYNVTQNNALIVGTFDTLDDAIQCIDNIMRSTDAVYVVEGYSDYDGESELWSLADEIELRGWANV